MEVLLNVKARIIAPVDGHRGGERAGRRRWRSASPPRASPPPEAFSPACCAQTAHATDSPAVPEYYVALPGRKQLRERAPARARPWSATRSPAGSRFTIRAFGKDKFVTVSAAADDRTFVLGANPNPQPPAIPTATEWYLVPPSRPGPSSAPPSGSCASRGRARTTGSRRRPCRPTARKSPWLACTRRRTRHRTWSWVRIYSAATGKLLHSWSGLPDATWDGYITLAWTEGGRQLAIGYTFALTPAGSSGPGRTSASGCLNVASTTGTT